MKSVEINVAEMKGHLDQVKGRLGKVQDNQTDQLALLEDIRASMS
jgi:hypothetical protein